MLHKYLFIHSAKIAGAVQIFDVQYTQTRADRETFFTTLHPAFCDELNVCVTVFEKAKTASVINNCVSKFKLTTHTVNLEINGHIITATGLKNRPNWNCLQKNLRTETDTAFH